MMQSDMTKTSLKPVVTVTLGDPAGIGPELVAKLLSRADLLHLANVVLVGDRWLWKEGQAIAGLEVQTVPVSDFAEVRDRDMLSIPAFLEMDTIQASQVTRSRPGAATGASVLSVLNRCMDAALVGHIDAITFAPLNKHSMKLGGLKHEDELHHFARYLCVEGYFCEFNTLNGLWTARISSHVPLKDVPKYLDKQRIIDATSLIYKSLQRNGITSPRVAVAGLNPHNGDGGTCGREEIDIIAPAVAALADMGIPVQGPFPADTIFLKARDGELDAIVTMYHDQGQIAIKLMGFSQGVTVQGGLPIPITTPAHGTAFDISGTGQANVEATANAFKIACRMGLARLQGQVTA
ncbi:4-hydroxythreonine-4-phosphate dehydrogenase PdxA [Verminephrobacter eiseniae]|uniref:4-hydroxythreonine-4-phosphate dehydrogenase PdxA n=1 Tax=Verminephrobacter eiseniae TaxID=364317 RepID=UPI002237E5B0|nr:4-hydroxythreonine-4-phosphate dehydrogenase PdxA [Verminephrobacter eiseniae]MCW5237329.1 4-hydroxythreonine-4-phosphate dehydrogenase PdxA [Verminephrobacter eiseniae]